MSVLPEANHEKISGPRLPEAHLDPSALRGADMQGYSAGLKDGQSRNFISTRPAS